MATVLTKNFTLEELYASATAKARKIDNTPTVGAASNLLLVAQQILQPLRDWWGKPIKIGSGYRCKKLNEAVGGVRNSQHMTGEAVDICIDGDLVKGKKWFNFIRDYLVFDQLIWEHNAKGNYWIHVSFSKVRNRKKVINNLLKK